MKYVWLLVASIALLGASPSIFAFGSAAATGATITGVTMSATPVAGDQFVAELFQAAGVASPSLATSWSGAVLVCNSGNFAHYYTRPVVSGDTSSNVVPLLSTATANTHIAIYEISDTAFATDGCSTATVTGTTSPFTVAPSLTPTYGADLLLAFDSTHIVGTGLGTPSYTQCASFSNDTTANVGAATTREAVNAGNLASVSTATTCSMSWAVTSTTITGQRSVGALIAVQGGSLIAAPCLLGLLC